MGRCECVSLVEKKTIAARAPPSARSREKTAQTQTTYLVRCIVLHRLSQVGTHNVAYKYTIM